jgi:hypothetical protein
MFYLERSYPQRWGRIERVEVKDTSPPRPAVIDVSKLEPDELATLEQLLLKSTSVDP